MSQLSNTKKSTYIIESIEDDPSFVSKDFKLTGDPCSVNFKTLKSAIKTIRNFEKHADEYCKKVYLEQKKYDPNFDFDSCLPFPYECDFKLCFCITEWRGDEFVNAYHINGDQNEEMRNIYLP